MEALRNSETSVNFNVTTLRYVPEDSKLHTRRREYLKSHTNRMLSACLCAPVIPDFRFGFQPNYHRCIECVIKLRLFADSS
jgi:hypothetical protein